MQVFFCVCVARVITTAHCYQRFLCLWFMSSWHSASSPFTGHDGTSFKAELHQRDCNRCWGLSDVSLFPFRFKGLISQAKLHTVYHYCHYCYFYNFYKSLLKLSDWNPCHPIQRLQQVTHQTGVKLVFGRIFGGYSLGSAATLLSFAQC